MPSSSAPNPSDGEVLFELPIQGEKDAIGLGGTGKLVCTQPKPQVYVLTFTYGPDNRLVTALCRTLILALDILQHRHAPGVVITTSGLPKFYSNGMELEHSAFTRAYMPDSLYALWHRLLTYPMPTVALLNGHAFAGGLMVAMMHDYRVLNPHRGYLCLNELELGLPLRPPMLAVFRQKLSGSALRKLLLEAHRFAALEALQEGLVDHLGGLPETLAYVEELGLVRKAQPGFTGRAVYGEIKREMWRETVGLLDGWAEEQGREEAVRGGLERETRDSLRRVREWEGRGGKAKL